VTRHILAATALAFAAAFAATPAHANHTVCDNEASDIRYQPNSRVFVGTDLNSGGGAYFCVNTTMVFIGFNGAVVICTHHTPFNGDPDDDVCPIRLP
jgi:hypothetical protein